MACEWAHAHRGAAPLLPPAAVRPTEVRSASAALAGEAVRGAYVDRLAPLRGAQYSRAAPITPTPSLTGHPWRRGRTARASLSGRSVIYGGTTVCVSAREPERRLGMVHGSRFTGSPMALNTTRLGRWPSHSP